MSDIIEQENDDRTEEELPVLTAQRFLNIFRQIHIFSDKKKSQFDAELLALSSEVIKSLSSLPGSSPLLDHIDSLKGISSADNAIKEARIRAAKYELDEEASKQISKTAEQKNNPQNDGQNLIMPMFNANNNNAQASSIPLAGNSLDPNFAEDLSSSLSFALEKLENRHNKEISIMMTSIVDTLKTITDKNEPTSTPQNSSNIDMEQLAGLLNNIISAQTQIFSNAVNEQTKAISEVLSAKLQNQQPQIIEKIIYEKPRSDDNNQIKVAQQPVETIDLYQENEPDIHSGGKNKLPAFVDDSTDINLPDVDNIASDSDDILFGEVENNSGSNDSQKKKKNKKKKNKNKSGDSQIVTNDSSIPNKEEDIENNIADLPEYTTEPEMATNFDSDSVDTPVSDDIENIKDSMKSIDSLPQNNTDDEWSWDKLDDIQASIEKDAQNRRAEENYTQAFEAENEVNNEKDYIQNEAAPVENDEEQDIAGMFNELIDTNDKMDKAPELEEYISSPAQNDDYSYETVSNDISNPDLNSFESAFEASDNNDSFESAFEDSDNSDNNDSFESAFEASDNNDSFESAFEASDNSDSFESSFEASDNSDSFESSFEASDNDYSVTQEQQENTLQAENSSADDEWEWEYEEVPADGDETSSDDDEWEWEYEEVPADGNEGSQSDDSEWEWEYEEESDNDNNKK